MKSAELISIWLLIFYSLIFKESSTSQVCVLSCSDFYHFVLCLYHRKLERKGILLHRLFVKFGGHCDVWFAAKFDCKSLPFWQTIFLKFLWFHCISLYRALYFKHVVPSLYHFHYVLRILQPRVCGLFTELC